MQRFTFAAVALLASVTSASTAIKPAEAARLASAARVVQDIHATLPQEYWDRARCVVVIPDLKKAAFIVGGEYGKGVMSCRAGESWSAPAFMQLAKGSWGFQAGAEQVDVVLLVMNESGVQKLLENKVTLGADASIAAGPIGRQGHVGTDASLKSEIISYSRAQGLFAGIDLSGGVLRPDEDANVDAYGPGASPRTILASRDISAPTEATPFLDALRSGSSATAARGRNDRQPGSTPAAGQAPAATPGTASPGTLGSLGTLGTMTDADLRARIVDMQQTLDRILADATSSAVGTSGTPGSPAPTTAGSATGGGTIPVERARLMRLRQQLDAILAAIDRR
jgi:lipid-binding SYLF domain-containing protein